MSTSPYLSDLQELLPRCNTRRQTEVLQKCIELNSIRGAADALGISRQTVQGAIRAVRRNNSNPFPTEYVYDGQIPLGASTYVKNEDGTRQWIKTKADPELAKQAAEEFIEGLTDDIKPRKRKKIPKVKFEKDLMVAYPIGDHHFGMYSWAREAGHDYDLKIAKQLLEDAVDYLTYVSPPSEEALLINLGDYLHIDNRTNMTPGSGHILDTDSRYPKVITVAANSFCHSVERLLEKHKRVKIVSVAGNHDPNSAHWLPIVLKAWFRNEPRVEVESSPAQFLFHQFGKNMLCMTHGDKVKLIDMPQIMAGVEPEMWGGTKFRMAMTGHVHHSQTVTGKENRGAIAESFGVLPPSDAYSASMGYHSQREMHSITFRRSGGILCRNFYNAELSQVDI